MTKGFTLIELLIVIALSAAAMFPMAGALANFGKIRTIAEERASSKVEAIYVSRVISHMGKLAERCSATLTSLECDVRPDPTKNVVNISFVLVGNTLTYKNGQDVVWNKEVVDFTVCSGSSIAGGCTDGNPALAGALLSTATRNFANYYRITLKAKLSDGQIFPVQTAFFVRNSVPGTPHYAWSPKGGTK